MAINKDDIDKIHERFKDEPLDEINYITVNLGKENLFRTLLNVKLEGKLSDQLIRDLAIELVEFFKDKGELNTAAYVAQGLDLFDEAMRLYEKIGEYGMAAFMAEQLNLKEKKTEYLEKEIESHIKEGNLQSAAGCAESAGLYELAAELYNKSNEDIGIIDSIRLCKERGLKDLLFKYARITVKRYSEDNAFVYAAYAYEAIDDHPKAQEYFRKAIEKSIVEGRLEEALVLYEISGLSDNIFENYNKNINFDVKKISEDFFLEECIQEKFGLDKLVEKTRKIAKVYKNASSSTSKELYN